MSCLKEPPMRRFALAAWSLLLLAPRAGAQSLHLTGEVSVDPRAGILDGALCTGGFSPRRDLRFLLSASLNVRSVAGADGRDLEYEGDSDGRMVGEAREYVVEQDSTNRLTTLCVAYRGSVPHFDSNTATADWKGRIAAMRGVLRAAEQTRWYPTLFDSATGRDDQAVTFRIRVSCGTCRAIYVNGARPVRDTAAWFESAIPRELLLLAGEFDFTETDELTFIAGGADRETRAVFSRAIREIGDFYVQALGIPYRDRPVLLSFLSIWRDRRPGVAEWQFVTWPTIAFSGGITFDKLLVRNAGVAGLPIGLWTTLSHEMAHYYFGTIMQPVGPLRWFALESTAEYLSLQAVYAFHGRIAGTARLVQLAGSMGTTTLSRLDQIREEREITGTYRYQYAPVFLHQLGRRVGQARVIEMLRALLATPDSVGSDFATVARAAQRAGLSAADLTAGWDAGTLRAAAFAEGRAMLQLAVADSAHFASAVTIASNLVNADTALAARLAVLSHLKRIVASDSTLLAAHYQIGRVAALTGQELDAAQASLELYLRHPVAPESPSHASALWRLGMIEEHRGRLDHARAAYREALVRDPKYRPAAEALARLPRPSP
jgi:TolA-binding protein